MNQTIKLALVQVISIGFVVFSTLQSARQLGVGGFGEISAVISLSNIFLPFASFRLETRILQARSNQEASRWYSTSIIFSIAVAVIAIVVAVLDLPYSHGANKNLVVSVVTLSNSVLDCTISYLSFQGLVNRTLVLKFIRISLGQFLFALFITISKPQQPVETLGFCYLIALLAGAPYVLSILKLTELVNLNMLKSEAPNLCANVGLGLLNSLWLNCGSPFLVSIGQSILAGQYALCNRIINTPFSVISAIVSFRIQNKYDDTHKSGRRQVRLVLALMATSVIWSSVFIIVFNLLPQQLLGNKWELPILVYASVAIFNSFAFSIGSISVVAIRQKDEWFVTWWQLSMVLLSCVILLFQPSPQGFAIALTIGGLSYLVLLKRWLKNANKT